MVKVWPEVMKNFWPSLSEEDSMHFRKADFRKTIPDKCLVNFAFVSRPDAHYKTSFLSISFSCSRVVLQVCNLQQPKLSFSLVFLHKLAKFL